MGRIYTAVAKNIAVSAAQDFFEILAATGKQTKVRGWAVGQTSELGDSAEEQWRVTTNRGVGAVTSGSGGSSVTAQPRDDGDAAFSGTIERNNTTPMAAGSGSLEELEAYTINIRAGYEKIYPPGEEPIITPGNHWTLELESTPVDSVDTTITVTLEEEG